MSKLARDLKWAHLEQRRKIQRLTLMYKIVHGEVAVTPDQLGLVNADSRTRASHCHKFRQCSRRTGSFLNVTVKEWNLLPANVVEADSSTSFKSQLSAQLV